jgi:hypothetical protein
MKTSIFDIQSKFTTIGDYAFAYCESLTSITIPSSVTNIGDGAFEDCYSFTSITIPSSVTSIGNWAFEDCYSLNAVYYTGTESEWNAINVGANNDKLTNATRYYYSETAPTTEGNYWHYVDGEIVVW